MVCVVIMAEVRLVNRYIIYIFYDDIIILITTMQVHILYNTVWVILFVVAASLLYRTAVPYTFFVPFKKYIRVFRAELSIEFVVALWATNYFIV